MTEHIRASTVDPARLIEVLQERGYRIAGVFGRYTRMSRPGESPLCGTLVIPTDPAMGDYQALMGSILGDLQDVAQRGEDAAAVLALLAGQQPVVLDEPDPLDYAMWTVYMQGDWRWVTQCMTSEAREAAVSAVMRYDRWLLSTDGEPPSPRDRFVWWEN